MSGARQEILDRIAAANREPAAVQEVIRAYRRTGALGQEECVALFCTRVGEYRAEVHRVSSSEVAATISSVCAEHNARTLVVPPGLPGSWRSADLELVEDRDLSARELDQVDGALTGCTAAVAETGTIVLAAGPSEGRRALTLVPDLHICLVREPQVVELLPQAFARISMSKLERQPITFISGPSATSDIELRRVEGVHGPRSLVVLVVKESQ